jgi:hypothetical protein
MFRAVLAVALIGLFASSALALDYANDATKIKAYKATVDNLANAAGGTSETDNNVATVRYTGGVTNGNGRVEIEFDFPTWSLQAGTNTVWLVVDGTVVGTVRAQVREVNGVSNISSLTTISGSSMQDQLFGLNFNLSSDTQVTSLLIRVLVDDVGGSGASVQIDAVATPEPGTLLLFGLGALGLGVWNRRRVGKKKTA